MNNKEIVKHFYEVVVSNNLIDEVDKFVSSDCVVRSGSDSIPIGLEGMKQHLIDVKKTYSDYTMKIIRQHCDGDCIIFESIIEGTHKGEWLGMKPTNKRLSFPGVDIERYYQSYASYRLQPMRCSIY